MSKYSLALAALVSSGSSLAHPGHAHLNGHHDHSWALIAGVAAALVTLTIYWISIRKKRAKNQS
jgi:hypothetical protein